MDEHETALDQHVETERNEHLGNFLARHRAEQGRDLTDIAMQTRVPLRHLKAIEDGLHENLPAMPYTIGFVKSYARALGLDPEDCALRFRRETTKSDRIEPTIHHEPIEDARVPSRRAAIGGIALLGLVAAAIVAWASGWLGGASAPETPVEASTTTAAPAVVAEPVVTSSDPVGDVAAVPATSTSDALPAATATAPAGGPIVVSAREDAWVKIYDSVQKKAVYMGVMAAGDRYEVPADRRDLLLWTGRAGALDVTVGGQPIPPLGAPTQTVKDVPLTAEGLAARSAAPGQPG